MGQLNPPPPKLSMSNTDPQLYLTQVRIEQDLGCIQIIENALVAMDIYTLARELGTSQIM